MGAFFRTWAGRALDQPNISVRFRLIIHNALDAELDREAENAIFNWLKKQAQK
jgi:hypothetical protein